MALTNTQLQALLTKAIGNRTDYTSADLLIQLNLAIERIARENDFRETRQTTDLTLSASGTAEADKTVDISSLTRLRKIYNVVVEDGATSWRLRELTPQEFDEYVPLPEYYARGNPEIFTQWNESSLLLWPVPDSAYTARIRWYQWPVALSAGSDTPALLRKDDIIVFMAASQIFTLLREEEQAAYYLGLSQGLIKAAHTSDRKRPSLKIQPNFTRGFERPGAEYWKDPFDTMEN